MGQGQISCLVPSSLCCAGPLWATLPCEPGDGMNVRKSQFV